MSAAGKNLRDDPWSTCGTCRFWTSDDNVQGLCLRHAPSPLSEPNLIKREQTLRTTWPVTDYHEVCGEFAVEVEP